MVPPSLVATAGAAVQSGGRAEAGWRELAEQARIEYRADVHLVRAYARSKLYYSRLDRERPNTCLLRFALDEEPIEPSSQEAKFTAPTSMRDVEVSVHLWVERGRSGGRR